jgi:hypothetical protein
MGACIAAAAGAIPWSAVFRASDCHARRRAELVPIKENAMSKEQKTNREKKKPKKDKSAQLASSGTAYAQAAKAAKK